MSAIDQQSQPLLLPPPPLTPQQTLALAVAIAAARVRARAKARASAAAAAAAAGSVGREDDDRGADTGAEEEGGDLSAFPLHLLPSSTATALTGSGSLRVIRLTKDEARRPLARRLAPLVEAMCLLPSLPPTLRDECLAHARALLLLQPPSAGTSEAATTTSVAPAVASVVRGVLAHLLSPSEEDDQGRVGLLPGACAGLEALFLRPQDDDPDHATPSTPDLLTGLIDGCARALQALGRRLLLEPDSVPLPVVEALPVLLVTYERAVLARWALALADEGHVSAGVLSSLLDALVAAAQALRPFRLGEAAVWRILARLKQRAAAVAVTGDLVAVEMECCRGAL